MAFLCLVTDAVTRNIAETFKTPGKLRGKTPRTARKAHVAESRMVSCKVSML